jgi:hypothetical protein
MKQALTGVAYEAHSVIASAQRNRCFGTKIVAMNKDARSARSDRPSIRSSHSHYPRYISNSQGQTMDLPLRMRQSDERAEHNANLWSHAFLRMPSEGICRSDRANVRRLDGVGAQPREASADTVVVPMCVRHREDGLRVQSCQRHCYAMHAKAGPYRPDFWKMDRAQARQNDRSHAILAVSLRVRHRAGCSGFQSEHRHFSIMRMSNWSQCQEAVSATWSGEQQTVLGLGIDAAEMPKPEQQSIFQVWRSRYSGFLGLGYFPGFRARHGADLRSWSDARSDRRERQLLPRKLHVGANVSASRQPATVFGVEASCA